MDVSENTAKEMEIKEEGKGSSRINLGKNLQHSDKSADAEIVRECNTSNSNELNWMHAGNQCAFVEMNMDGFLK